MVSTSHLMPDLAFYILTALLLVGGVGGIVYAFFGDRHRRTPMCRKCHYNMQGHTSLTCPECGYEHQRESELFKPKRHPKLAAVGLILILLSGVSWYYPEVRYRQTTYGESWVTSLIPTTWFLHDWPYKTSLSFYPARRMSQAANLESLNALQRHLLVRGAEHVLSDEQPQKHQHFMIFSCLGILHFNHGLNPEQPPHPLLIDVALGKRHTDWQGDAIALLTEREPFHPELISDALIAGLASDATKVQNKVLEIIKQLERPSVDIAEVLVTILPPHDPTRRPHDVTDFEKEVCETLIDIGPAAMPALVQALTDEKTRGGAIYVIDQLAPYNAEAAPILVRQYTLYEDDIAGSYIGHHAEVIGRMGEAATPAMVEALLDPDPWVRLSAIEALREIYKPDGDELWKTYAELRPDPRSDATWTAISGLWELADRESDQTIRERAEFVARELTVWRQDVYRLTG